MGCWKGVLESAVARLIEESGCHEAFNLRASSAKREPDAPLPHQIDYVTLLRLETARANRAGGNRGFVFCASLMSTMRMVAEWEEFGTAHRSIHFDVAV